MDKKASYQDVQFTTLIQLFSDVLEKVIFRHCLYWHCVVAEVKLQFRSLLLSDAGWLTEIVNDPDAAKYLLSVYPITQYDVAEFLKKDLESNEAKHIVAELDSEPAVTVSIWWRIAGRDRHVAWLGVDVRTKHWGKGVGSGLMQEAIRVAKELGFRKMTLGMFEGNERAMRLYMKFGFRKEAYEKD